MVLEDGRRIGGSLSTGRFNRGMPVFGSSDHIVDPAETTEENTNSRTLITFILAMIEVSYHGVTYKDLILEQNIAVTS